jgi:hypothetical protein
LVPPPQNTLGSKTYVIALRNHRTVDIDRVQLQQSFWKLLGNSLGLGSAIGFAGLQKHLVRSCGTDTALK